MQARVAWAVHPLLTSASFKSSSFIRRSSFSVLLGSASPHSQSGSSLSGFRGGSEPFFRMLRPVATSVDRATNPATRAGAGAPV